MQPKVRVRFAPSPTGPLHIGGVRTAIYNYLYAKKFNGDFILRIEDTDQTRFVSGAEDYIIEAFKWLNITFDEGVGVGGIHAPYRQSERTMYRNFALELVEKGWAYYAFDTPQELDDLRKQNEALKRNFQYDSTTRQGLRNSLSLSKEAVEDLIAAGEPYVIRFCFPADTDVVFNDLVRGEVKFNTSLLDDKVLYKSDGLPTYHLANVVDDHLMEISHVIRGEEWLPSCPLHVMLYKAFGWSEDMPQFAHLPLLLKPEGSGKLSKRDGDRLGFPVFPLQWSDPKSGDVSSGYRESGYIPQAVVNMLALLGWNDGTEKEIYSMDELIEAFSIDRISKHGAKFDVAKAKWFNHQYFQKLADDQIAKDYLPILNSKGLNADLDYVTSVVSLVKERCDFLNDLWDNSYYFFKAPETYDEKVVAKRWKDDAGKQMAEILIHLRQMAETECGDDVLFAQNADTFLHNHITEQQLNMGQIMNCIRLALVGEGKGVNLADIMRLIGSGETIRRIEKAIEVLGR
ncbi:MAG: glutamate--tRNA ligase [Bacteroidales bacterium]|jgi:glutamyl-tRNA synthetase|nr:glutamate--tRNA ligase [Bacteroidales bacterium]